MAPSQKGNCRELSELDWLHKSKLREVDGHLINQLTDFSDMTYNYSLSIESAGGILHCWNASLFIELARSCTNRFVAIKGHWRSDDMLQGIICVYAMNNLIERIECFNSINSFAQDWECSDYIIFGDFNAILQGFKRWGINVYDSAFDKLTTLVNNLQLQDLPLSSALYFYFGTSQVVARSCLD